MGKCRYNLSKNCRGKKDCLTCVLDRMRLDIALAVITEDSDAYGDEAKWLNMGLRTALEVIDKYKAEINPQERSDKE